MTLVAVSYNPKTKQLEPSMWTRETVDPRKRTIEHATDAYVSGQIEFDEFEQRVDMAIKKPDDYCRIYQLPPPPPPLPPPSLLNSYITR